ncbi:S41 family peptidase [Sphingomonas asaccharolytica]|uniref:S41 family peptidase n=1 Tax=Sphingomonas asaccharolytica TaxID=40681 RepID=UPI000833C656|nr:S41 family peptidase [Sphingomonas asaccharolytica]
MRFSLMIAAASLAALAVPASAAPFDRAAWQQDYAQLKQALERGYANLAWKASGAGGVDLPALDRATNEALARATSDAQAIDAIRAFVAGFHDGHFSELPYRAAATGPAAEPADAKLTSDDAAGGCAALGFASTGSVAFTLPFEQLPGFRLVSDGLGSTFRTGTLSRVGAQIGVIRIQAFRARAFPDACLRSWAALWRKGKPVTADAVTDAAANQWFADLFGAIRALRQAGVTALVIDIGNNSGGDDSGDWAARLFTDRPVRSSRLLMVDALVSAGYFDEQIDGLGKALAGKSSAEGKKALSEALAFFTRQKQAIGQQRCDLSWSWREQRPWSPTGCNRLLAAGYAGGYSAGLTKGAFGDEDLAGTLSSASMIEEYYAAWTGPTYVVTDQRSYSAAEMFAAVMQDNRIAKIVGVRTGQDGCGFMTDAPPLVLTHSHLRFRMPNCMRLRADGSNEEAGITPDIPILPTDEESDRARADRAVVAIAEDIARSGKGTIVQ